VASEVDLAWTYVGGSASAVDRLLGDARVEAVPAAAGDPLTRVEAWVQRWVDAGTEALLTTAWPPSPPPWVRSRPSWRGREVDGRDCC
jgi:hypothetical protein